MATQARLAFSDPNATSAARHMRQPPTARPLSAAAESTTKESYSWPKPQAPVVRRERAPKVAWTPEFAMGSAAADLIFGHGATSKSGWRDKSDPRPAWRPAHSRAFSKLMTGAAGSVAGTMAETQAADLSRGTAFHPQQRRMSAIIQPNAVRHRRASSFDGPSMEIKTSANERTVGGRIRPDGSNGAGRACKSPRGAFVGGASMEITSGARANHCGLAEPRWECELPPKETWSADNFVGTSMVISEDAQEVCTFESAYGSAHEGMDEADNFIGTSMLVADTAEEERSFDAAYGTAHEGFDNASHFEGGSMVYAAESPKCAVPDDERGYTAGSSSKALAVQEGSGVLSNHFFGESGRRICASSEARRASTAELLHDGSQPSLRPRSAPSGGSAGGAAAGRRASVAMTNARRRSFDGKSVGALLGSSLHKGSSHVIKEKKPNVRRQSVACRQSFAGGQASALLNLDEMAKEAEKARQTLADAKQKSTLKSSNMMAKRLGRGSMASSGRRKSYDSAQTADLIAQRAPRTEAAVAAAVASAKAAAGAGAADALRRLSTYLEVSAGGGGAPLTPRAAERVTHEYLDKIYAKAREKNRTEGTVKAIAHRRGSLSGGGVALAAAAADAPPGSPDDSNSPPQKKKLNRSSFARRASCSGSAAAALMVGSGGGDASSVRRTSESELRAAGVPPPRRHSSICRVNIHRHTDFHTEPAMRLLSEESHERMHHVVGQGRRLSVADLSRLSMPSPKREPSWKRPPKAKGEGGVRSTDGSCRPSSDSTRMSSLLFNR